MATMRNLPTIIAAAFLMLPMSGALAQTVQIGNARGDFAAVIPDGSLAVTNIGTKIFYDAFELSFDTAVNWNAATSAGGGVGEVWSAGQITLGTGTTANGYSYVSTQHSFQPVPPGYLQVVKAIKVPATIPANTQAYWGMGTPTVTPTAASPITEGCGFEILAAATSALEKMYVTCFAGSTRTIIQDLSASTGNGKQPLDGTTHTYFMYFRGDFFYFCIDNVTNVVAIQKTGVNGPNINTQPIIVSAAAGTGAPLSSLTITVSAVWVGDTGRNGVNLCDLAHPWQCGTVNADGSMNVNVAPSSTAASGITPVVSSAAEGTRVFKASAGSLYSAYVTSGATAGFLMIFNSATAPGDGAVTPIHCVQVPANTTQSVNFNPGPPEVYATGISAAFSSTGCFTKTVSATAFFHGSVK